MATIAASNTPEITKKSLKVFTSRNATLSKDVTLLFTLTPVEGAKKGSLKDGSTAIFPIAWEVMKFSARARGQDYTTEWYPAKNLALLSRDQVNTGLVSADVAGGKYADLGADNKWNVYNFFNAGDKSQIISMNNARGSQDFVLGATPSGKAATDFQGYIAVRLATKEGVAFDIPCYLQIYDLANIKKNQVVSQSLQDGLLIPGTNLPTGVQELNINTFGSESSWELSTEQGKAKLTPSDEFIDLQPIVDALMKAAKLIEAQIPHKNVKWAKLVWEGFGTETIESMNTFMTAAAAWEGYNAKQR